MNRKIYHATVYPLTKDFLSFINPQNNILHQNIEITAVTSPFCSDGCDVGFLNNTFIGIRNIANINNALDLCDTLLISYGNFTKNMMDCIIDIIFLSISKNKNIICTILLEDEIKQRFQKLCLQKDLDFIYCIDFMQEIPVVNNRPYKLKSSVVFVGELISGINSIDTTMEINTYFRNRGYKTSSLICPHYASLLGFHEYSQLYGNNTWSIVERIDYFKRLLNYIDEKEKPDLLIVQIQGGMMCFNEHIKNEYGIYAYMISQALLPDCFILTIPCFLYTMDFYSKLSINFLSKFGYAIDFIHVYNAYLDYYNIKTIKKASWCYLPFQKVDEFISAKLNSGAIPAYSLCNPNTSQLCYAIEQKLLKLGEVHQI